MNTRVSVSLHELRAADLSTAMIHESGHVSACVGSAATQLHWPSLDEFDAWVDRLHSVVHFQALLREDEGAECVVTDRQELFGPEPELTSL